MDTDEHGTGPRWDRGAGLSNLRGMRNPHVTTNRTVDASSLDSIVAGVVRPGMTEERKALALYDWWRGTIYHYGWPYTQPEDVENWQDPVKCINVHGYGLCGSQARTFGRLLSRVFGDENVRLIGFREEPLGAWKLDACAGAFVDSARLRGFTTETPMGHSSFEVRYGGRWRFIDPHVHYYAYLRNGEGIAGAEDLIADPTLVTRPAKRIKGLMPCGDLSRVLYASEFINWGSLTREAAPDDHVMEITLRRGDTYTRYWDRKGPFVWFDLLDRRWDPEYLEDGPRHLCEGDQCWRHYGNGELNYAPRLTDLTYRDGVTEERGLAQAPDGLQPAQPARQGSVTFATKLPYMISQATLTLDATRRTGSDRLRVWVRPAGGTWRMVWEEPAYGRVRRTLDLTPWIVTRYAYDLRFDLRAARQPEHAALHAFSLDTTFLLNYLALPRLLPGRNRVTVAVADPAELREQQLDVTYAWADREGEHEETRPVATSPYTYDLTVAPVLTEPAENPKYMRFLRLSLQ